MAKQTSIDDKANTPVQGTEGAAETDAKALEAAKAAASAALAEPSEAVTPVPEYVQTILDSNQLVIESNEKVVAGLEAFKEHAIEFISAQSGESSPDRPVKEAKEQKVDLKAAYIVSEGKSFRDSKDFTKEYKAGDDVTAFDEEVLLRLLNQGLIEAVEEED